MKKRKEVLLAYFKQWLFKKEKKRKDKARQAFVKGENTLLEQ